MFRFGDPGGQIYATAGTNGANILAHWTAAIGAGWTPATNAWWVQAGGGRSGGTSLRTQYPNGSNNSSLSKTLDAQQTWGMAFAWRAGLNPVGGGTCRIASLLDVGTLQCDLRINSDGTFSITRGGTVLGTSIRSILSGAYNHYEWKTKIDPSAGTTELRVNGTTWIGPLTGINTRITANSSANIIKIGDDSNVNSNWNYPQIDYSDLIVWDSQLTDANGFSDIHDFIGDCGLVWLPLTGAGTTTQFTPDTGSNYARLNEATPDGDSSYVESNTVGQIDTYAMTDLAGTTSSVKSLATVSYSRKSDTGARGMKTVLRSGGGNTSHASEIVLGTSYQYYFQNWGQNPNNGSPVSWIPGTVNTLEPGQTVSS